MEALAPPERIIPPDNVGLLAGSRHQEIHKILVALDLDDESLTAALSGGYGMVITHHPAIYRPLFGLTEEKAVTRRLTAMIRAGICLYAAHTNLDVAEGGTNDIVFERLGLMDKRPLVDKESGLPIGRVGRLPAPSVLDEFAAFVKKRLDAKGVRFVGDLYKPLENVGLCTGSGMGYLGLAQAAGCDVYLTGDVKYHDAQAARDMGLAVVDAGHFATECWMAEAVCQYLRREAENDGVEVEVGAFRGKDVFRWG